MFLLKCCYTDTLLLENKCSKNFNLLIWIKKGTKALISVTCCTSTALSWSRLALEHIAPYHCEVKTKLLLLDYTGDQKAGSVKALTITELTFTDSGTE